MYFQHCGFTRADSYLMMSQVYNSDHSDYQQANSTSGRRVQQPAASAQSAISTDEFINRCNTVQQ